METTENVQGDLPWLAEITLDTSGMPAHESYHETRGDAYRAVAGIVEIENNDDLDHSANYKSGGVVFRDDYMIVSGRFNEIIGTATIKNVEA